jgi:hypothetical protein
MWKTLVSIITMVYKSEKLRQNIFIEIFSIVSWFASGYFAFYRLHRPESKTRRYSLLAAIALWAILLSLVFVPLRSLIPAANVYFSVFSLSVIALLCNDLRKSFFSVLYFFVVALYFEAIIGYFYFSHTGYVEPQYTKVYYFFRGISCIFEVGWAYLYYRIMRSLTEKVSLSFWLITILPAVGGLVVIFLYDYTVLPLLLDKGLNIFFQGSILFIFLFALNLFIFYMYIRLVTFFDLQMKTNILQSQLDAQIRQNRLIEGAQKQAGEIRHQMKNLLFALQIELDHKNYDGIRTRLNSLVGELKQYEQKPYTAVPVIDAMIAYKEEHLRECGAALSVTAELLDISDELAYDITSLVAIALDNAIDTPGVRSITTDPRDNRDQSSNMTESSEVNNEFLIRLSISRRKNLLFMQVSKPLTGSLKYHQGELQNTKDEPEHGFGLPALRRIVERYSGEVKISDKDDLLSLKVMLMINADLERVKVPPTS